MTRVEAMIAWAGRWGAPLYHVVGTQLVEEHGTLVGSCPMA